MKLKNNIKKIIEEKGISVNKLATLINSHYPNTYKLVNDEYIDSKQLGSLVDIATVLDVEITELYTIESK